MMKNYIFSRNKSFAKAKLFVIGVLVLVCQQANATCIPPVVTLTQNPTVTPCGGGTVVLTANVAPDQSQLTNTTCMADFSQTDLAQSFIPAQNTICGAGIFLTANSAGSGTVTIQLYDNLPNASGNLLATGSVTVADNNWAEVTWPTVSITPGNTYYLVFTSTNGSQCVAGNTSNPYPNGEVYANAGYGSFPTYDYTFHTTSCGAATYLWSTSATTPSISVTTNGTYTCTVTVNGCPTVVSTTITFPPNPTVTSSATSILCNGGNSTVTVAASGGTSPYTGIGAFTEPAGGPYTFTVTDNAGCTGSTTISITQPTLLTSTASSTPILCNGGNSTVTVAAAGGTPPYTGTGTFTEPAGTYTFTVTDNNGCSSQSVINVTQPTALTATSSSTAILCNGGNSTVTVAATGGTSPYTGTGTFTETAGTYTFTVTDNNGCSSQSTINVTQPTTLAATSSSTSILCNGGNSTVTVAATGGTSPYTGTGTFTETAGTYSFTVTDNNGCSSQTVINVTQPTVLSSTATATSIPCNGGNSTVTVAAAGGTSPYTGTGTFTETAGTYTFTVTDNNGCTNSSIVNITQPTTLSAAVSTTTNPTTCSGTNGAIDLTVTGGTTAYTFAWSNSTSNQNATNLSAGTYSCIVTDANGCTVNVSNTTLTDPTPPTVTVAIPTDTVCQTQASFSLTGGSPNGGTYSGPGVAVGSFNPATANVGMNHITYSYTDATTGCSATAMDSIVVEVCTGINGSAMESNFTLMPNPNNGTFTLQLNTNEAADVMIYDALGQLVSAQKVQPHVQQQLNIATSGVYMLTVVTADGKRSTQRVVVNK